MSVVRSTGSRFLCYEPLIDVTTVQNLEQVYESKPMAYQNSEKVYEPRPMAYQNLEQVYEPRLQPVTNGTNVHSFSKFDT